MNGLLEGKSAFLFQGVGAKYKEFLSAFDEKQLKQLEEYSKIAKEKLNIDLWQYAINEAASNDNIEFLDWILIYTSDYIVYKTYLEKGVKPHVMTGYSMGLITAMVCAEALSFEGGLLLLDSIYKYPTLSKRVNEAMATIIGFDYDSILQIIEGVDLEEYVEIASENSEHCIVISGVKNAVNTIMKIAEEEGAIKVVHLNTPYAYHSSFSSKGIELIEACVKNLEINKAKIPIMSVFTQNIISDVDNLRKELVLNMYTSMKWKSTILKLGDMGINSFIEVTLNDSLTKMSKVIALDNTFMTYEEIMSVKK